jgi:hypothetical protein
MQFLRRARQRKMAGGGFENLELAQGQMQQVINAASMHPSPSNYKHKLMHYITNHDFFLYQ